jgi:D-lactate dehydrogenase
MLALNRKIVRADKKVKDFNFALDDLIGFDMNGKTAGIIGLGKIGGIVAKILHGLGCKILGFDIYKNEDLIKNYGVEYCNLETLASRSDIITIHAPLNESSKYLINKPLINQMKPGVMLINTGRGAIINTRDVIDGLVAGKIGYLGLDVYEHEKGLFFYDHSDEVPKDETLKRLYSFPNVLVTGHQAFLTETALNNISDITINNLDCWEKKKPSPTDL